jgi:dienelactone hydrolase
VIGILIALFSGLMNTGAPFPEVEQLPVLTALPDPLTMANGETVTTPEEWQQRREEITAMLLHYQYGHAPPPPGNLRAEEISREEVFEGAAHLVRLVLKMGPEEKVQIETAIYVPEGAGKKPVLLAIEPVWNPSLMPAAQEAVRRGYLFAGFHRHDLDPDDEDRTNGVHPLYPGYDWATLAVWAWGASRVVDYLHTRDDIDTARIALTGHSRAGKTALLAAALDDRIALVAPHGSGAGGAGSFRVCGKNAETLFLITAPNRFHYWFQPRLRDFAGKEDRLPFDQHFLRALIAPRALVSMDGLEDLWANPPGTKLMWEAAQPVFDLLGASDRNLLYFRPGGHDMPDEHWTVLLDYCDHFFL